MRARIVIVIVVSAGLVAALAPAAQAAFPGANGEIVFSARRFESGTRTHLFTIYPFGVGETAITSGPRRDKGPAWSPDGTRIAFSHLNSANHDEIHTLNPDGSGETMLTDGSAGNDSEPAWSPDGTRIAYVRQYTGIMVMSSDGSGVTVVRQGSAWSPAWSPDGSRIAYARNGIWTMKSDGSDAPGTNVTGLTNGWRDMEPSWSPDGSKIAFASDRSGGFEIYVINRDGSGLTRITEATGGEQIRPAWSPDGRKILFASDREDPNRGVCNDPDVGPTCLFKLYVMDADGGNQTKLSDTVMVGPFDPEADDRGDWQRLPVKPYVRPKGATPLFVHLVPAFVPCGSPNDTHGAPLSFGSCSPPIQASSYLTVGTPDSNGQPSNLIASVRLAAVVGNPATPEDEADVAIDATTTDVRVKSDLSDYAGELRGSVGLRLTDRQSYPPTPAGSIGSVTDTSPITVTTTADHDLATGAHVQISGVSGAPCANGAWTVTVVSDRQFTLDGSTGCGNGIGGNWQSTDPQAPDQGTVEDFALWFPIPCTATSSTSVGSTCSVSTTADALAPGTVVERERAIWQLDQVQELDGGGDGSAATQGDNTLFLDQGTFVP